MGGIGEIAECVNIGGQATGRGTTGNMLLDTLAGVPTLMKTPNVENEALNGKPINDEQRDLVSVLVGPAKGILVNNTGAIEEKASNEPTGEAI